MEREQVKGGLRVVSIFEATKGLLVLLTGFGLLAYLHKDLHLAAEHLVRRFHLNPARHYPRIFLDLADNVTDAQLWVLALSALLYAVIRFVEAYGLWLQRRWAEWFGLVAGGIYVPIEIFEVTRKVTWPRVSLLIVNTAIVVYLSCILYQATQKRKHAGRQHPSQNGNKYSRRGAEKS
jgi:uncharacterized membrane protein (DUF2068 family)